MSASSSAATSDSSIIDLAISHKRVRLNDKLTLNIAFKDFYIIRSGECDFTGLRVWPGAELLAKFVMHAATSTPQLLTSQHCICELGAGVGLSGLVAASYAQHVILTDRVPVLLDLMRTNIETNHLTSSATVAALDWGQEGATKFMQEFGSTSASASPRWDASRGWIMAADVVYPDTSDEALIALFVTVNTLLGPRNDSNTVTDSATSASASASSSITTTMPSSLTGCFICSYFSRDADTTKRFLIAAAAANFIAEPIEQKEYDEEYVRETEGLQGIIICFRRLSSSAAISSSSSLPSFLDHPSLKRLWQPELTRAQRAVEELNDVTAENAFSGLQLDDDEEEEENTRQV